MQKNRMKNLKGTSAYDVCHYDLQNKYQWGCRNGQHPPTMRRFEMSHCGGDISILLQVGLLREAFRFSYA